MTSALGGSNHTFGRGQQHPLCLRMEVAGLVEQPALVRTQRRQIGQQEREVGTVVGEPLERLGGLRGVPQGLDPVAALVALGELERDVLEDGRVLLDRNYHRQGHAPTLADAARHQLASVWQPDGWGCLSNRASVQLSKSSISGERGSSTTLTWSNPL